MKEPDGVLIHVLRINDNYDNALEIRWEWRSPVKHEYEVHILSVKNKNGEKIHRFSRQEILRFIEQHDDRLNEPKPKVTNEERRNEERKKGDTK